jgi:hypothetical protein
MTYIYIERERGSKRVRMTHLEFFWRWIVSSFWDLSEYSQYQPHLVFSKELVVKSDVG